MSTRQLFTFSVVAACALLTAFGIYFLESSGNTAIPEEYQSTGARTSAPGAAPEQAHYDKHEALTASNPPGPTKSARTPAIDSPVEEEASGSALHGQVIFPPNIPDDERATVVATSQAGEFASSVLVVGMDRFAIAIPESLFPVTLGIRARYLYLENPVIADTSIGQPPIRIRPFLGGRLEVTVVDSHGAPSSGSLVHIAEASGPYRNEAITNSDGNCVFDALPPSLLNLACERSHFGKYFQSIVAIPGETLGVVMGPRPEGDSISVFGEVTLDSQPAPSAKVLVSYDLETARGRGSSVMTDSEGLFDIQLERPGTYVFEVRSAQSALPFATLRRVPDSPTYRVDLHLPTCKLAGRVISPRGSPQGMTPVQIQPGFRDQVDAWQTGSHETFTDSDGNFQFFGLLPGSYCVTAGAPSALRSQSESGLFGMAQACDIDIAQGEERTDIALRLTAPCSLSGLVLLPDGNAAAYSWVYAQPGNNAHASWLLLARTNEYGEFRATGLPTGQANLIVRSGDFATSLPCVAALTPEVDPKVTLRLEAASRIVIRAQDEDGHPVAFRVRVLDAAGSNLFLGGAGRELRYRQEVGPLPPSSYVISGYSADGLTGSVELTVDTTERVLCILLEMK